MNLTITGHHLEITPAIHAYVRSKLTRVFRHSDQVIDSTVRLSVAHLSEKEKRQKAEIDLHLRGKDVHVESAAENLYEAIDTVIDKLDRQVLKYKNKLTDHHHEKRYVEEGVGV